MDASIGVADRLNVSSIETATERREQILGKPTHPFSSVVLVFSKTCDSDHRIFKIHGKNVRTSKVSESTKNPKGLLLSDFA